MKITLSILLLAFTSLGMAIAGPGTVRGTIKDAKTKDPLIGATVLVEGTEIGAAAEVDGSFVLNNVPAGTHKVIISFVSYKTKEIPEVRVESGNTTVIETELDEEGTALQEVVVRGAKATNTEVAVISEIKQMKPIAVGISAQQIQKSQDRDAAAAIRRVPGVSIVENRFVMIRGLGSRYNSVLINDVITPSSEVDTRSFSFDLVPSNIIDRMIVYKSGSAESPGDFAGGIIKIYTKRRPDQNFTEVALTGGYRANTTFQNVTTHERSGLNFLGLWGADQTLSSAFPKRSADFNTLSNVERADFGRLLPNSWATRQTTASPDLRLAVNLGRRFEIGNVDVSNLTNINYSLTNQYSEIALKLYQNGDVANDVFERYTDANYARQSRIGVLHNWTFRFSPVFNLEWKTLFNQLGNTETVVRDGQRVVDGYDVRNYSERFENRSIVTTQVSGEHKLSDLTKLNWITGFGYTGRWEPDWKRIRFQRLTPTGSEAPAAFQAVAPNDPNPIDLGRFFSKLNERVLTLAVNGEHALGNPADREPNRIRFGVYGERKDRDYSARFYGYNSVGNASAILRGDLGTIFSPQNLTGRTGGLTIKDGTKDLDSYQGINNYYAAYLSGDVNFGSKAIMTVGFRGEFNNQQLHSYVVNEKKELVNNKLFIPLPSLNFTYKVSEKQNLRLAFSSTLNRAEFRELAPFTYFDFNLQADIRGNTALKTAKIQNLDAKWEYYPSPNELISVTGFYKYFKNPIETFLLPTGNGLAYTFINANNSTNYGLELEVRKGFPNASSTFLQNLSVVGNASIIASSVNLGQFVQGPDLSGNNVTYDLTGVTDTKRPMANQSPYLVNAGLYYAGQSDWSFNVLYNVFGQRIFAVGNLENPTVYEMPRNVVDLNISKKFKNNLEVRLGIQDLLNQPVRFSQDFNRDGKVGKDVTSRAANADQDIRKFRRGSYFTLTAAYVFGKRTIIP
ncbi:TonB-dependent receptor [Dyadobacter sandarakinus]|uniref:Carboxypeptidase-like regulatory domain-containing protein n=1 Tax=Dyadobacter sandarakinus TaxID=2747268 RepID=A0ABX7I5W9_9BACT|nr:TonB-dependent receptor [Dyadobacter sandarakinus]QRR01275.1 carboxypeptidase-like regulatory domain-containing protein [Dyadobacter sandarakinus]